MSPKTKTLKYRRTRLYSNTAGIDATDITDDVQFQPVYLTADLLRTTLLAYSSLRAPLLKLICDLDSTSTSTPPTDDTVLSFLLYHWPHIHLEPAGHPYKKDKIQIPYSLVIGWLSNKWDIQLGTPLAHKLTAAQLALLFITLLIHELGINFVYWYKSLNGIVDSPQIQPSIISDSEAGTFMERRFFGGIVKAEWESRVGDFTEVLGMGVECDGDYYEITHDIAAELLSRFDHSSALPLIRFNGPPMNQVPHGKQRETVSQFSGDVSYVRPVVPGSGKKPAYIVRYRALVGDKICR